MEEDCTLNANITKELIWRRNAPYFYQLLFTTQTEWPNLAVEWWVEPTTKQTKHTIIDNEEAVSYLCIGTHTAPGEQNYLQFGKIYLPRQDYAKKIGKDKPTKPTEAIRRNEQVMEDKLKIMYEVEHEGEVNQIRHHPQLTNLIATRTPLGELHIFDKNKFKPGKNRIPPILVLAGHQTEGYAIQWNSLQEGRIYAGSYDGRLSLWDLQMKTEKNKVHPLCYFEYHDAEIEDLSCSYVHESILISCDDAGLVALWDSRAARSGPLHHFTAHDAAIYAVQFSPQNEYVFASGGADSRIKIWDIRNLSDSILSMEEEAGEVMQLKWSMGGQMLWSVAGSQINMWDVAQQQMKFVHGGHSGKVARMDIHPQENETIVSVDESNGLHVFQPNPNCYL